jgi:hypothetical protein
MRAQSPAIRIGSCALALTNVVAAATNYWFVDMTTPPAPKRVYRVAGPAPSDMVFILTGTITPHV